MVGYGVNVHAPRMPFVTTTVLLKWPLKWALGPFWTLLYCITMNMISTLLASLGVGTPPFDGHTAAYDGFAEPFADAVGIGQDEFL